MYENAEVKSKYAEILSRIENEYQFSEIPFDVMEYYRLVILVYRQSFQAYFNAFGWSPIDERAADQGKLALFGKNLSLFEKDTIAILNQRCCQKELEAKTPSNLKLLPPRSHERASL